jgi:hypothetical protein
MAPYIEGNSTKAQFDGEMGREPFSKRHHLPYPIDI